jgi:hypothetical protein
MDPIRTATHSKSGGFPSDANGDDQGFLETSKLLFEESSNRRSSKHVSRDLGSRYCFTWPMLTRDLDKNSTSQ